MTLQKDLFYMNHYNTIVKKNRVLILINGEVCCRVILFILLDIRQFCLTGIHKTFTIEDMSSRIKIGINASFLRKPDAGIGQVTRGFIHELVRSYSAKNEYFLYLEEDIDLKLPENFHKRVFLPKFWKRDDLVRKIWWEKWLLPKKARSDSCELFISLYQCPTVMPAKIEHKMLVHDMIWNIFPQYLDNWRKKFYAALCGRAAKKADSVVTVSNWSKRDIHKYLKIPLDKISIANPSIGDEFFSKSSTEKDNEVLEKYGIFGTYVFYIGGFDFRKNVERLLIAYKILINKNEFPHIQLIIGGEDKSRFSALFADVKRVINDLDLEEKVKMAGFIGQQDLPALYRQCQLFVLPSLYEGFGLMALEAMACGAPAAVSKTSSLPEVCGDAVLYFNPNDEHEMAKVMAKILTNKDLQKKLSEKGIARAKKFSWEKFVNEFFRE